MRRLGGTARLCERLAQDAASMLPLGRPFPQRIVGGTGLHRSSSGVLEPRHAVGTRLFLVRRRHVVSEVAKREKGSSSFDAGFAELN